MNSPEFNPRKRQPGESLEEYRRILDFYDEDRRQLLTHLFSIAILCKSASLNPSSVGLTIHIANTQEKRLQQRSQEINLANKVINHLNLLALHMQNTAKNPSITRHFKLTIDPIYTQLQETFRPHIIMHKLIDLSMSLEHCGIENDHIQGIWAAYLDDTDSAIPNNG